MALTPALSQGEREKRFLRETSSSLSLWERAGVRASYCTLLIGKIIT